MQFGFMPGKGTLTRFLYTGRGSLLCFCAFDRVLRDVVRWTLSKLGIDEWPIRTVMVLYIEACTVVRSALSGVSGDQS